MTEERTCFLCSKPIKKGEPQLVQGPGHWQTFTHERCVNVQYADLAARGETIVREGAWR